MTKRNECSEGFNAILKVTHGMALSGVSTTCEKKGTQSKTHKRRRPRKKEKFGCTSCRRCARQVADKVSFMAENKSAIGTLTFNKIL